MTLFRDPCSSQNAGQLTVEAVPAFFSRRSNETNHSAVPLPPRQIYLQTTRTNMTTLKGPGAPKTYDGSFYPYTTTYPALRKRATTELLLTGG